MDRYYDNTRISGYEACERSFYFRHVRNWAPDSTKAALVFGSAWHAAMDVVWAAYCGVGNASIDQQKVIAAAMQGFEGKWVEEGFPSLTDFLNLELEEQKKFLPRTPMVAAEMLYGYIEARGDTMRHRFKPADPELWIEEPFAVPLDPTDDTLWYVGRWDKRVIRVSDSSIFGIEHKTTTEYKKDGYFKGDYIESFNPNSQVEGYLYAGKVKYGNRFKGIMLDHALVHKDVHDGFAFTPIELQMPQLEQWLWTRHNRIGAIERDIERLDYIRKVASGEVKNNTITNLGFMSAFPQRTGQCVGKYGRCPFLDLCRSDANPERWEDPPAGWKVEKWSPFDELALSQLGLPNPETGEIK